MSKVIIFCQAGADVRYVLSLYEKFKHDRAVTIYLLPGQPACRYLERLSLDAEVILLDPFDCYFSFKKWKNALRATKYYSSLWRTHFSKIQGADIYFFSAVMDWVALPIIGRLAPYNNVLFVAHYPMQLSPSKHVRLRERLFLLFFRIVTRSKMAYYALGDARRYQKELGLDFNAYDITTVAVEPGASITEKYRYDIPEAEQSLLFIDSPAEAHPVADYEEKLRAFFDICEYEGVSVWVKPHPRVPLHPLFQDYDFNTVPAGVPGEFLPLSNFRIVVGTVSTLTGIAGETDNTYTIMHIFKWRHEGDAEYAWNRLKYRSHNSIQRIDNLQEITGIFKELFADTGSGLPGQR